MNYFLKHNHQLSYKVGKLKCTDATKVKTTRNQSIEQEVQRKQ